jgi:hypothetical protein
MGCDAQFKQYILKTFHTDTITLKEMIRQANMTYDDLKAWRIPSLPSGGGSLQPYNAMLPSTRLEFETVNSIVMGHDEYNKRESFGDNYRAMLRQLRVNRQLRIYRASIFPIVPGSYVSESREYAVMHKTYVNAPEYKIWSILVSPSMLGWYGDPHEFIFLPTYDEWKSIASARVSKVPKNIQELIMQC